MKAKKCICCGKESRIMIFNQLVSLCPICNHIISNKMNYNFQNKKSTNILDIIREINNWDDKALYNAHISLTEDSK